ncbi:rod shape-determining protein, partial [Candidatus Berkelbacteria bacterium]|nr:rod shape-determining protein [Candidatus Berkelbacteria bacterium]
MLTRVGIDLGTSNIRFALPGKGVVINEPTVAALSARDQSIIAVGHEAKRMLGRTPESIIECKPMRNGAIASFRI